MLARKRLIANASCCLTEANRLSNMYFYLEILPDVRQIFTIHLFFLRLSSHDLQPMMKAVRYVS